MNSEEQRILHALYFGATKDLNEGILIRAENFIWAMNTRIPETRKWKMENGGLDFMETDSKGNYIEDIAKTRNRVIGPISFLQASGYIDFKNTSSGFQVKLTAKGAEYARELDSFYGRLNLAYKARKDGIWNIAITILVAVVTAFLTSLVVAKSQMAPDPAKSSVETELPKGV